MKGVERKTGKEGRVRKYKSLSVLIAKCCVHSTYTAGFVQVNKMWRMYDVNERAHL